MRREGGDGCVEGLETFDKGRRKAANILITIH